MSIMEKTLDDLKNWLDNLTDEQEDAIDKKYEGEEMSKKMEIEELLKEMAVWLMWEPKVGEICEFSDWPNFPDDKTVVGYFVRKTDRVVWSSKHKHLLGPSYYLYVRPIKGGGE